MHIYEKQEVLGFIFNFSESYISYDPFPINGIINRPKLCFILQDLLKASAHPFKQFTSRLLKSTFSLSMHIYNSDGRHA